MAGRSDLLRDHCRSEMSMSGSPSIRSPLPLPSSRVSQRMLARLPFSCGYTYGVCIPSTVVVYRPTRTA